MKCQSNQQQQLRQESSPVEDQNLQYFIEEQEDLDMLYDNCFLLSSQEIKSNQHSLLDSSNTVDQFEEHLFDIFRNYKMPREQLSNSRLRRNSTTSYLATNKNSSSSLNEEQQTNQTEEKDKNFRNQIIEKPLEQCEQAYLNNGIPINTQNDLENQKKQDHCQLKRDIQLRQYLKKSKVNTLKSNEQIQYLESHFIKSQRWKRQSILKMSQEIGLSFYQIYKWNWDRRMALKQYHENNKYFDCRYIKVFEVVKCPRNKQEFQHQEEGDDTTDYRIFKTGKI